MFRDSLRASKYQIPQLDLYIIKWMSKRIIFTKILAKIYA